MSAEKNRTTRYKEAMAGSTEPMTVRQICDKAEIPAAEAKFVSSGLIGECKKGRAENVGQIVCPVTQRKSIAYRLVEGAPIKIRKPKAAKLTVAANDDDVAMPDPVMSGKAPKIKKRNAQAS